MAKITELTDIQKKKIIDYQSKYRRMAATTKPANHSKAERAAKRLAKIAGVKAKHIVWVVSPVEGGFIHDRTWDSSRDLLVNSFVHQLEVLLNISFEESYRNLFKNSFLDSIKDSFDELLEDTPRYHLDYSFGYSLGNTISNDFFTPSVTKTLIDSFENLLYDSIEDWLKDNLRNWLRESAWSLFETIDVLAYYSYAVNVLGIEATAEDLSLLKTHNELAASCFAVWFAPEKIIICERPEIIKIKDGELVKIAWRKEH